MKVGICVNEKKQEAATYYFKLSELFASHGVGRFERGGA